MPGAGRDPRHSWASGLSSSCREAGFARDPAIPARLRPPPNPWRRSIRTAGKEKPLFLANAGRTSNNEVEKDRKSTRLNSSHLVISYAVFCLKKKKQQHTQDTT